MKRAEPVEEPSAWSRLAALRKEKNELIAKLTEMEDREAVLRSECYVWLGNTPADLLTRRESEILVMLRDNPMFSNKDIGSRLNMTERTVKFHLTNTFSKFGVHNKRELLFAIGKTSWQGKETSNADNIHD